KLDHGLCFVQLGQTNVVGLVVNQLLELSLVIGTVKVEHVVLDVKIVTAPAFAVDRPLDHTLTDKILVIDKALNPQPVTHGRLNHRVREAVIGGNLPDNAADRAAPSGHFGRT